MTESRIGWLGFAIMIAGLLVTYEVCFRAARRRGDVGREARRSQADVAVAGLLALLGLLLAFSFEMGADRFDRRRMLVLDEANAITTTYLRASMVPAPYDARLQELLRRYVHARSSVSSPEELERALRESGRLHTEMWADATAVSRAMPDSPIAALFVASLNKMIDLHEARVTVALYQRLPPSIFSSLYLVALLAMALVGIRAGLDRVRGIVTAGILISSIMSVMALIGSLDSPTSRLFEISKHAMDDTERLLMEPTASARLRGER